MNSFVKLTVFFLLPLVLALYIGEVSLYSLATITFSSLLLAAVFCIANQEYLIVRLSRYLLLTSYVCLLFFVLFKSLLYDFTGSGFNDEVYYHLSWDSFKVGFSEYTWQLSLLFVFIIAYFYFIERLVPPNKNRFNTVLAFVLTGFYLTTLVISPMGDFLKGYYSYRNKSFSVSVDITTVEPFIGAGFLNSIDIKPKQLVSASSVDKKNLILIYLESFNQFLLDDPEFNHLTPNMRNLGSEFHHFKHENSAFVTIEGIISSQCGTMLSMNSGNDSFMKASDAMSELPCLSDVLKTAGYKQFFLGGAKMEFAGKGDFLKTHGYEHVWGMEHWRSLGKNSESNVWGLSDTELFQEAINVIRKSAQSPPYNLTLLTLGTHIPGFVYPGCETIENDNQFLASIACTDLLLSQFINQLKAENLLDNTLVVVVADHGVFPNPKMKALFGEKVFDRRLVGITNQQVESLDQALASYDLAPTILDWLNIKHTANFLFGKSLKDHDSQIHHHITRYTDWFNGTLVRTIKADCKTELSASEPLNSCDKENLNGISQQVLVQFAKAVKGEKLPCDFSVYTTLTESTKEVMVNHNNQYQNFHYQGYNLETRQFETGHFILEISNDLHIVNTLYFKLDDDISTLPAFEMNEKSAISSQAIEIVVTTQNNQHNTKVYLHTQNNIIELHPNNDVFNLALCEN